MIIEEPIMIVDDFATIFGILRYSGEDSKLVILIPPDIGTRSGPQRMYVHISRMLAKQNIGSLAVDLPPNGDSFDNEPIRVYGSYQQILDNSYQHYLKKIIKFLTVNYFYSDYVLLTFSAGCLPVLRFADLVQINNVILMAPDIHKSELQQNFASTNCHTETDTLGFMGLSKRTNLNILNLLPENDPETKLNETFWKNYKDKLGFNSYKEFLIEDIDHNFSAWKCNLIVGQIIINWIKCL